MLITRVATVALIHTGLSHGIARFQARSAFTNAGFTTQESEKMVNHPVRRRIIMVLMLMGNVGIATVISSLMLTFLDNGGNVNWGQRLLLLAVGLGVIWLLASSRWANRLIARLTYWILKKYTKLDVRDYVSLLRLVGDYGVTEFAVEEGDWLANQKLSALRLNQEGIIILGIQRHSGRYIGVPQGHYFVRPKDTLILYGRSDVLASLDERNSGLGGELAHQAAIARQKAIIAAQDQEESSSADDLASDDSPTKKQPPSVERSC